MSSGESSKAEHVLDMSGLSVKKYEFTLLQYSDFIYYFFQPPAGALHVRWVIVEFLLQNSRSDSL